MLNSVVSQNPYSGRPRHSVDDSLDDYSIQKLHLCVGGFAGKGQHCHGPNFCPGSAPYSRFAQFLRNRNKPVSPACCANSPATPPLTISIAKNESGASGRVLRLRCCCATSSRRQSRRASTWFQGNYRVDELFLPRRRLIPAHVPFTQHRPPAANPSVTLRLRLGLAPSQEIAPLGSVHIAAKHLAEHALNGSFSVRLAGEHAPPLSRLLGTNCNPGSPDA